MAFINVLRLIGVAAFVGAALCGCQGDDNALPPLPSDAGAADAHSDATAPRDGAAEASADAGSAADGAGDAGAQGEAGDSAALLDAGDAAAD